MTKRQHIIGDVWPPPCPRCGQRLFVMDVDEPILPWPVHLECSKCQLVYSVRPALTPLSPEEARAMPKGSKVERCYEEVRKKGKSKGSAAAICQTSTHEALATGRRPKTGPMAKAKAKK